MDGHASQGPIGGGDVAVPHKQVTLQRLNARVARRVLQDFLEIAEQTAHG